MNRIMMGLLLASWAVAIAQVPPGEERSAGAEPGEQVLPCVSAADTGPLDGEQADTGPGPVPCKEQDPEAVPGEGPPSAEAAGETVAIPETIEVDDSIAEPLVEEEFTPVDEISEDYPVPLPSDI